MTTSVTWALTLALISVTFPTVPSEGIEDGVLKKLLNKNISEIIPGVQGPKTKNKKTLNLNEIKDIVEETKKLDTKTSEDPNFDDDTEISDGDKFMYAVLAMASVLSSICACLCCSKLCSTTDGTVLSTDGTTFYEQMHPPTPTSSTLELPLPPEV